MQNVSRARASCPHHIISAGHQKKKEKKNEEYFCIKYKQIFTILHIYNVYRVRIGHIT